MLRLAKDGMFSFSQAPLRFGFFIGTIFILLALAESVYVLSFWTRGETSKLVPGWSSLMMVLTISSGTSMLLIAILGIYIGMIFEEVKRRPVYLIRRAPPGDLYRGSLKTHTYARPFQGGGYRRQICAKDNR